MEIIKTPNWTALPTELSHKIAEMPGRVKLRNGVLMQQISKDDPRRQILENISKIVLSSHYDGDDNLVLLSIVETKITINGVLKWFVINSILIDPDQDFWSYEDLHEDNLSHTKRVPYREATYTIAENPRVRAAVNYDGTITRMCSWSS